MADEPPFDCECDRWDEATQSVVPEDRPHACRYQDGDERHREDLAPSAPTSAYDESAPRTAIEPPFDWHGRCVLHGRIDCPPCAAAESANEPPFNSLRFAYADPPYVGCSHLYDHPDAARWDHPDEHCKLARDLDYDYDGWALSCSTPSLADLLPRMPEGTRVAAWVKPFAAYKRNVRVAYTWEPVLWKRTAPRRDGEPVGRDHLSCSITMKRGLTGAKPEAFAAWLRVLLGHLEGDQIVDLFPGSGAITASNERPRLAL